MVSDRDDSGGVTLVGHELTAGRLIARIAVLIGAEKAMSTFHACMTDAGLTAISSSQDMLRFSNALVKHGGPLVQLSRTLAQEVLDTIMRQANNKLTSALGPEKSKQVVEECLQEAGLTTITTPQELLNFAKCLANRGGVAKVIGHSLKIQALLDGAAQIDTK